MKDFLIVSTLYHLIGDFWASIVNTIIVVLFIWVFSYTYFNDHYSLTASSLLTGLCITGYLLIQSVWIWFNKDQILANENSDQRYVNDVVDRVRR